MGSNYSIIIGCTLSLLLTACGGSSGGSAESNSDGGALSSSSASSSESSSSSSQTDSSSSSSSLSQSSSSNASDSSSSESLAENLSLDAGSDGSSKATGTSYGNVRDGDVNTYWAPNGGSGRISIKWDTATAVDKVIISEATELKGNIGDWQLVNNDTGDVIASGNGAGEINFTAVVLSKINFEIVNATGVASVAEFETYGPQTNEGSSSSDSSGSSSSSSSTPQSSASSSSSENSSSSSSSSQSSSLPPIVGDLSDACIALVTDDSVNWDESTLQTDQDIIECLKESLGTPVGFGENTTGGYDSDGASHLVVITNNNPEEQILAAISSADHNWIVFDKDDFSSEVQLMMYRPYCGTSSLPTSLGLSAADCRDPYAWCSANSVAQSSCLDTFFNSELNNSSLPVRNYMIDSNTTIDGRGAKAAFVFNGFKIGADSSGASTHQSDNVIITHNRFVGVGHVEDHDLDPDMIRSTGESHDIWIHQNTFDTTGDSAFDVKVGAYDITVSFNRLVNVKRAALHGSSDSRTINAQITTTLHNNLFVTHDQYYSDSDYETLRRVPLMRRGQSHMFNNVFYNYRKDILSVRVGGRIDFDSNMVLNNAVEAANNSNSDDMDYFIEKLLRDFQEGGLEVHDSYVWFANADCQLQGDAGDLTASHGSTPDMMAQYSAYSQSIIAGYRMAAGQDLAEYLYATAGKGAFAPWLSPMGASVSDVLAAYNGGCQ